MPLLVVGQWKYAKFITQSIVKGFELKAFNFHKILGDYDIIVTSSLESMNPPLAIIQQVRVSSLVKDVGPRLLVKRKSPPVSMLKLK